MAGNEDDTTGDLLVSQCAAANPAIALWFQSTRPAGRVAELGSSGTEPLAQTRT